MVNCELYFVDSDLFIVRCKLRNVSCQKWTASEPVLEGSKGVLSRLGSVLTLFWRRLEASWATLETSWRLQNQSKIDLGALVQWWPRVYIQEFLTIFKEKPVCQGLESKSSRFGVSKAVKMEANLIQNWYKNSTSNKDSFTIPHRQVFERKLRPKSSTFLVDDIATRNII